MYDEDMLVCILSLLVEDKAQPSYFKQLLSIHNELVHVTVEVNLLQTPVLD